MAKLCKEKELNGKNYRCFFELTLSVMGGKWKPIILFHLSRAHVLRFGELGRSIDGITQRMLTKQLRELEADQIINRKVYKEVPPKVEYSLTELGKSLIPIFIQMREWGIEYEKQVRGEVLIGEGYEREDMYSDLAQ
ncbi:MAG: helix-turn-helix transcriptional regulator [Desulfovibrionales bacterium]|nr:helix-turn-helix transcriptional regulator [Desulfovibrionales bacterium]